MLTISKDAKIAILARGGPHNGPYAAGAMAALLPGLAERGLEVANIYGNSGSVPAAVLSSVYLAEYACDIWRVIEPRDIIVPHQDLTGRVRTVWRLLNSEAVFDDTPLERMLQSLIPFGDVFSELAIPVKIMTVDYLTGLPVIFSNKNPKHQRSWLKGMLGSMALSPFLKPQVVRNVQEDELLEHPYMTAGELADTAVLFDGGYSDNLMFDAACRDGNDVVFVVDINGVQIGPLDTDKWTHWSHTLQRAFHVLITTNDQRRLTGVIRTNEILEIRDALKKISGTERIVERMTTGWLKLENKHKVQIVHVANRTDSRPFDFSSFKPKETTHLIHSGQKAARKALEGLVVS